MSKNEVVSRKLGMSASTARSRLVKMLLFRELQRSQNDKCFKCGTVISDIDHLSIEHKVAWLNRSPDLFWDLDNIEFSHLSCNRPDPVERGHNQKRYQDGCRCDECKSAHATNNREWRYRTGRRNPRGL
jgi:hypothetical protein